MFWLNIKDKVKPKTFAEALVGVPWAWVVPTAGAAGLDDPAPVKLFICKQFPNQIRNMHDHRHGLGFTWCLKVDPFHLH